MNIIPCGTEHFEEMIEFVVRLNSEHAHHIGFFGEGEADVRSSLAESTIPPAEGFYLAYDGDRLAGVFGVDVNPEISRAWLFGPLIEYADWQSLADRLYAAMSEIIPPEIQERDLFCDTRNANLMAFAERHGFPFRSETAVMDLKREGYQRDFTFQNPFRAVDYTPPFFGQFERLHNLLFPNTYYTAGQIVEKLNSTRRLFILLENETLKGYHFCKVEPDARLGYVDFIGVDESVRGRGLGKNLLAAGVDWMFSFTETDKIGLTVNADNLKAVDVYEKFGFIISRVMRGYRKKE